MKTLNQAPVVRYQASVSEILFSFAEYPVACCGDEGEENPP